MDVAILTETRWQEDEDITLPDGGGRIINFPSRNPNAHAQYGMGIYMNPKWAGRYEKAVWISDRVAIFYFHLHNNARGHLVIAGVYGPTSQFAATHPGALEGFYKQLGDAFDTHKRKAAVFMVVGDFNSKIGQLRREGDEAIMGKYSIGHRNANGERLAEFLHDKELYLASTAFKHRKHHTATWHGEYERDGHRYGIHNQIDYIAIQPRHKMLLANARSHSGRYFESDHSLVVATFYLGALYPVSRRRVKHEPQRDMQQLYLRKDIQEGFENTVREKVQAAALIAAQINPDRERTPSERYENLKNALTEAVAEKVPLAPKKLNGKIVYEHDARMQHLTKRHATLWQRFRSTPLRAHKKRDKIRRDRLFIRQCIRKRIRQLNSERVQKIAAELEKNRGNRQMYEYARIMQKRVYRPLNLLDAEGFLESDPVKLIPTITGFYEGFFNQPDKIATERWEGIARPLQRRISRDEIRDGISRLRNHRAVGPDRRTAEEFKNGGEVVVIELEGIFNTMFETHSSIPELTEGFLLAMSKPDKDRIVDNTRPLTLLNTIRKILSTILLNRARAKIQAYVSLSQLGYLPGRSTTEAVWTMQWIRATVERYEERFYILGLDLSKAFDCLDREELLRIFRDEVGADEDEMRILRVLLADTSLRARIGKETGASFFTTIGTPQGDALSPCLFLVYLECIMRSFLQRFPPRQDIGDFTSYYADDTNLGFHDTTPLADRDPITSPCIPFCNCTRCQADYIMHRLPGVMAERNMKMNAGKTESHWIDGTTRDRQDFKLLGTNINQDIEVPIRTSKARGAMRAYFKIWLRNNPISLKTKMMLFQASVRPHITQNLHVVPIRRTQAEELDVLHRQFIRRVAGVFFPRHLGNTELYRMVQCLPLSVEIIKCRWRFLGHVLRLPPETPARRMMAFYFKEKLPPYTDNRRKRQGRRPTSIPSLLDDELQLLNRRHNDRREELTGGNQRGIQVLKKALHLTKLAAHAQDRAKWRTLADAVAEAALRRWQSREHARQEGRDGEDFDTDLEEQGDVPEQMRPAEAAPRGRRQR